jgi:beta-lactamase regulating signal transducer with metallopeptidase domain
MTPLAGALSAALLHFVWQGMAVAVPCSIALFLLRRRSATARYALSCGALAVFVALPVITTWTLYRPHSPVRQTTAFGGESTTFHFDTLPAAIDWLTSAQAWAVPVWACGVLFFSLRMTWGCAQVAGWRRRGAPAGDRVMETVARLAERLRVTRPIRVLVSTVAESPSVVGWIRPVILLPVSALAGLPPEQLEAVLAHELAHIRRHDYLVNLLQMTAESLLFYHPAVWWISARIRHERELCCDDIAASTCGGPLVYARALTALERMRVATPAVVLGAAGGKLLYRIRRLAEGGAENAPSKLSTAAALLMTVCCIVLGVNWTHAQQAAPQALSLPQPAIPSPNLTPATPRPVIAAAPAPQAAPPTSGDQAAELLRSAVEDQLRIEKLYADTMRRFLAESVQMESRLKELTRQPDSDEARIEQTLQELRSLRQRLLTLQAENRTKGQSAPLNQFHALEAEARRRATTGPEFSRAYELQARNLLSFLGRAVDPAGRSLDRVEFRDLPNDTVTGLGAVLPIKVGDRLTVWSPSQIAQVIEKFDPQLRFRFLLENESVVLLIEPAK